MAAAKKQSYVKEYGRAGAEKGWHFLTGPEYVPSRTLADAVGFRYSYDSLSNQYAHASTIIILTPEGRAARYSRMESIIPRVTVGSAWRKPRKAAFPRTSIKCCCTATTTIRRRANTAWSS